MQTEKRPLYVTFATVGRWILPDLARDIVLACCLHDNGTKLFMHGAVVMPDHVHLIFTALDDEQRRTFSQAEIMNGIKGASAHKINRALDRNGQVWGEESFDRILRSDESLEEKVRYLCGNPVRNGLVENESDYPWIWRWWVAGQTGAGITMTPR